MKITVLGASGGCGSWVVRLGVERGHEVRAVVRPTSQYSAPDGVQVAKGEVTDASFLASLELQGQVVLSCLGQRRAHLFPWSRLLSPPDLVQTVTRNLVAACPHRLVWISAGGVGDSRAQLGFPINLMIRAGNVGVAYADLEVAECLLAESELDSLAVRPVTLTGGIGEQSAAVVTRYSAFSTIHRRTVASWMLDCAEGVTEHAGRAVLLGTG